MNIVNSSMSLNLGVTLPAVAIPALTKEQAEVAQLVQSCYSVFAKNVESLWDAQVICLGDTHTMPTHQRNNAQIVDALYQPGDILLTEADDNSPYAGLFAGSVKNTIPIRGWDIDDAGLGSDEEFKKANRERQIAISPRKLIGYKVEDELLSSNPSCCKVISLFCCVPIFVLACWPCIRNHYKKQTLKYAQKVFDKNLPRNKRMCECIEEAILGGARRVFVMGGSSHFRPPPPSPGIDTTLLNQAVQETLDYLQTKKFAILIPNPAEESAALAKIYRMP